jgi:hypothetical protein
VCSLLNRTFAYDIYYIGIYFYEIPYTSPIPYFYEEEPQAPKQILLQAIQAKNM